MSQKSGFLIVSNGFFIENVGHTLTKNYNGTYWPLKPFFSVLGNTYCTKIYSRFFHASFVTEVYKL